MRFSALSRDGSFVPVWLYCGAFFRDVRPIRAKDVTFDDEEGHPANPVRAHGDGVQLAWAEAGAGPVLIKAANWLTHLVRMGEPGCAGPRRVEAWYSRD